MILAMAIGDKAIRAAVIDRANCVSALPPRYCPPHAGVTDIVNALRAVIAAAGNVDAVGIVLPSPAAAASTGGPGWQTATTWARAPITPSMLRMWSM